MIAVTTLPDGSLTLTKDDTTVTVPATNPTVEDLLAATLKAITDLSHGTPITRPEVIQAFKAICPERPLSSKVFNQPEFQNLLCNAPAR